MDKLTSFVFSGSGTRLFAFIGALRVLFAAGYRPKQLIGTSGGGLIALFIAAHYDPREPMAVLDKLEAFARGLQIGKLLDPAWFPRWPRYWHGPYKGARIRAKLDEALPAKWTDMKLPVFVVTSDRNGDVAKVWGEADGIAPALAGRATMSLPIFDAVEIQGHYHTDGGTRANYPLSFFGDDENVVGLRFRPLAHKAIAGPGEKAPSVQTFANTVEFNIDNIDDMIEATSRMHMAAAQKASTIMLDVPGSGMDFDVDDEDITRQIQAGAASAKKWLTARNRNPATPDPGGLY
jgi:NTE family protein